MFNTIFFYDCLGFIKIFCLKCSYEFFCVHVLGLRLGKIRMRDSRTQEPEQDMNYSNAGPQQLIYTPHQRN